MNRGAIKSAEKADDGRGLRLPKYPIWVLVLAALLAVWSISLFVWIASASLPVFDDYCRGSANPSTELVPTAAHTGYIRAPIWAYLNWQGRWLAVLVEILLMNPVDMVRYYPVLLFAL